MQAAASPVLATIAQSLKATSPPQVETVLSPIMGSEGTQILPLQLDTMDGQNEATNSSPHHLDKVEEDTAVFIGPQAPSMK